MAPLLTYTRGLLLQANMTAEVYRDDNNNVDIQRQRLTRHQHLAQRQIAAGWQLLMGKNLTISSMLWQVHKRVQTTWI